MTSTSHRLIDHNHLQTLDLQPRDVHLWRSPRPAKRRDCHRQLVIGKRKCRRLLLLQGLLLFIVLGLLPGLVLAEPMGLSDDIGAGSFFTRTPAGVYRQALRLQSQVHFDISGLVARTRVEQAFRNTSDGFMEGVYVFPLPDNAAVDRLRIHVGARVIEGVIKERQQARQIYRQAKAAGQRSALVEQERPNLFTTSVANIGPNEIIRVEITYQQTLVYRDGGFSLRFPMTLTPRYIPGRPQTSHQETPGGETRVPDGDGWASNTDQVSDAARITPPVLHAPGVMHNPVRITASLDAGFPLARVNSLYHDVRIERTEGIYNLSLQQGQVPMDRDFELQWRPAVGSEPAAAFFRETWRGQDYGLVMIMPPQADATQRAEQKNLAREVIFIIDTSGSMAGVALQQAKQALRMALHTLSATDRFNLVEFNSVTRTLFSRAVYADNQSVNMALQYVDNLQADGGTEMAPALRAALQGEQLEGYVRQVIFITDGSVGNETALFKLIADHLASSRLFTVGIGSAPNSYFMRKAAEFGRGSYTFISSQQDVADRMRDLFARLQAPVLTKLSLRWSGDRQPEVWPQRLPDLYQGEPLLISAKLAHGQQLTLQGEMRGRAWQTSLQLRADESRQGIAALWARHKIASLMDHQVQHGKSNEVRQEVVRVALQHQLVSRFTSLVAVDPQPSRAAEDRSGKTAIANNLPAGSQQNIQGYGFPQGASPSRLHGLLGVMALVLAWLSMRLTRRYEK
jgi:Ca-activated chloride channel family protein